MQQNTYMQPALAKEDMDIYLSNLSEDPIQTVCPNCNKQIMTEVNCKIGRLNYLISGLCLTNPW